MAVVPPHRRQSSGRGKVAENSFFAERGKALGTRKQGEDPEFDEYLFFPRHSAGVDGEESNHSVRQSAKRQSVPDVLTPEELAALLSKVPEPLRTAVELDAFTGLRRGELIGLQWEDVDFENLSIHVRRSVVMMVQGLPKTKASAKDVPLDAALAESLLKLKLSSPYKDLKDWVFASPRRKGKQPYWPDALWKRYGREAVKKAGITKRVGFHTFRHTYTTLLTQNGEDVKVVQELLRHANSRITLDLYAQAGMAKKRLAQSKLVRQVLKKGAAGA